jgi:hypothetical protein
MNKMKFVWGAIAVAIVIAIGGYSFPQVQQQVEAVVGATGTRFPNGLSADSTSPIAGEVRGTTFTSTGDSVVGDDLTVTGDNTSVNGITWSAQRQTMETATTTVCALRSPTGATSTLDFASANFTLSTTTAPTITLAKSATAFATTTVLGNRVTLAANEQATIVATTTAAQHGSKAFTFAPGDYFVVAMTGGIGTFSPTGQCQAIFREVD